MRILSIDVGIKNLAYCLFQINSKTNYCITHWDIIDLCNDKKYKCCGKTKDKKCTKFSKYYKNDKYYCKIHAKREEYKIPTRDLQEKRLKKALVKELKNYCKTFKIDTPSNYIKKDYLEKILNHLEKYYFNMIKVTKAGDLNLIEYGRNLKKAFSNDYGIFADIDIIIIENQIGPLALKMKVLQGMIMQHFIEANCLTIEQISPSNKLKDFIGKKKTTYGERKKLGIQFTREILYKNNYFTKWQEHFEKHKKKDDLADSFLQGLWYIKHNKLLKE